jgi:hypothetical protein
LNAHRLQDLSEGPQLPIPKIYGRIYGVCLVKRKGGSVNKKIKKHLSDIVQTLQNNLPLDFLGEQSVVPCSECVIHVG